MTLKNRFLRLGAVVAGVSLLTTQISVSGSVALAQENCPEGDNGSNSGTAIALGVVGAGILAGVLLGGGGAATAGAAGIGAAGASTIFGVISSAGLGPGYSVITDLVQRAGLQDLLAASNKSYTFFAPTDEAFSRLPAGVLDELKKDKVKLRRLLEGHIVDGARTEADLTALDEGTELTSRAGTKIKVGGVGGLTVGGARALTTDIRTGNGIIHTIDTVLTGPTEG